MAGPLQDASCRFLGRFTACGLRRVLVKATVCCGNPPCVLCVQSASSCERNLSGDPSTTVGIVVLCAWGIHNSVRQHSAGVRGGSNTYKVQQVPRLAQSFRFITHSYRSKEYQ
mgnify:CR=1 FL=1